MAQPLPVKDQLNALEHIQELDLKIDNVRKNKGSLPAGLRALDDQLTKAKSVIASKKAAIVELEKAQRQAHASLELNKDRLARSTARIEGVQNTHELQAATREVDQLWKQKETLELQEQKAVLDIGTLKK